MENIVKKGVVSCAIAALVLLAAACGQLKEEKDKTVARENNSESDDLAVVVDTLYLGLSPFKCDVVSNGKIRAAESADLYFRSAELIAEVNVRNGQRVTSGQVIARLDPFKLNDQRTEREAALAQARLELKDVLIGQGYNPDDIESVPADVVQLAKTRSGLVQAEAAYSSTMKDLENITLRAPFAGLVANLKGSRHSMASTSEAFCRIIDDSKMCVDFQVLESELPLLSQGGTVEVSPYSSSAAYIGTITEINPLVDERGHIGIKAVLSKAAGLVDGMNVRIRSSRNLGNRLVVPKTSVVLRSGRQVVFTYKDGKAVWNYVTTGLENLDSYEITEGLKKGDSVIIRGNENLAHGSPVKIIPQGSAK